MYAFLHKYYSLLGILSTLGHYGFLLGFWITLISPNMKWTPYAFFAKAIIELIPFTGFSLYTLISVGIDVFIGYWLLRFSASEFIEASSRGGNISA